MQYYCSVLLPVKEGGYAIEFPDLPEAISQGDTITECMDMATDVLAITVEEYTKIRKHMPKPCTVESAMAYAKKVMAEGNGIDATRKPLVQLFPVPDTDMTPVRISISIAKAILESIDKKAKQVGLTRSGFIAKAAQVYSL